MNTSLTVDGTHLRTTLNAPLAARLFGLPFLLVGGYLAYQLAGGVADLAAGRAAIAEMFAGTLLLIVMTAAFLIPGWLLVASRAFRDIDRAARSVTYTRDFRVYQRRDVRPLSEFDRIEVDRLTLSTNRQSTKPSYQIELAARIRQNVVVGLFDDGDAALAVAGELSRAIDLPVVDRRDAEPASDE